MKKKKELNERDLVKISLGFITGGYLMAAKYSKIPIQTAVTKLIRVYTKLEKQYRARGDIVIADIYKEEIKKLKKYLR
jgi:hypothetical protein